MPLAALAGGAVPKAEAALAASATGFCSVLPPLRSTPQNAKSKSAAAPMPMGTQGTGRLATALTGAFTGLLEGAGSGAVGNGMVGVGAEGNRPEASVV
jgi:hypothetical protein